METFTPSAQFETPNQNADSDLVLRSARPAVTRLLFSRVATAFWLSDQNDFDRLDAALSIIERRLAHIVQFEDWLDLVRAGRAELAPLLRLPSSAREATFLETEKWLRDFSRGAATNLPAEARTQINEEIARWLVLHLAGAKPLAKVTTELLGKLAQRHQAESFYIQKQESILPFADRAASENKLRPKHLAMLRFIAQEIRRTSTESCSVSAVFPRTTAPLAEQRPMLDESHRDSDEDDDDVDAKAEKNAHSLIDIKAIEGGKASLLKASWSAQSPKQLTPEEIAQLGDAIARGLNSPDDADAAFATFFVLSLGLHPRHFSRLHFSQNDEGIWLDSSSKCLCWKPPMMERPEETLQLKGCHQTVAIVAVPLPTEIAVQLRARLSANPGSTSLADLFAHPTRALKSTIKRFLLRLSEPVAQNDVPWDPEARAHHTWTVARVSSSYSLFVLRQSRDPAVTSAFSFDFGIGTISELHYLLISPEKLNALAIEIYQKLGFSGKLAHNVRSACGSRRVPRAEIVASLLRDELSTAASSVTAIKKGGLSRSELLHHFNNVSRGVALFFVFVTGLRAAPNSASRSRIATVRADLCIENALVLLSDKTTTPYHKRRLLPIPRHLAGWLKTYEFAVALVSQSTWISPLEEKSMRGRISKWAESPESYFFVFNDALRLEDLGTSLFDERYAALGLDCNSGRHWFIHTLRRDCPKNLTGVDIMVASGRSVSSQKPFADFSMITPAHCMDRVRATLERALDEFELNIEPPTVSTEIVVQSSHCVQMKWLKSVFREECPFREDLLVLLVAAQSLRSAWAARPSGDPAVNFILSLVFIDGISCESDISAMLDALERANEIATPTTKVDYMHPRLGLRRVVASETTARWVKGITACKRAELETLAMKSLGNDTRLWQPNWGRPTLARIALLAEAINCIYLPRVFSQLAAGRIASRLWNPRPGEGVLQLFSIETSGGATNRHVVSSTSSFANELRLMREAINQAAAQPTINGAAKSRLLLRLKEANFRNFCASLIRDVLVELLGAEREFSTLQAYQGILDDGLAPYAELAGSAEELFELGIQHDVQHDFQKIKGEPPGTVQKFRAAYGHLGRRLGVEFAMEGEVTYPTVKTYAPAITRQHVSEIMKRIGESEIGIRTRQIAQGATSVAALFALRRGEVRRLQIEALLPRSQRLEIYASAGRKPKSYAGSRIIPFSQNDVHSDWQDLCNAMVATDMHEVPKLVFEPSSEFEDVWGLIDSSLDYVSHVLREVTQDEQAHFHNFRHLYASEFVSQELAPSVKIDRADSLELRNVCLQLSAAMGHSSPLTSFVHYSCGLSDLLPLWVSKSLRSVDFSSTFIASNRGISQSSVRSIRLRTQKTNLELVTSTAAAESPAQCEVPRPVATTAVPHKDLGSVEPSQKRMAAFFFRVILGQDPAIAAQITNLSTKEVAFSSVGLRLISSYPRLRFHNALKKVDSYCHSNLATVEGAVNDLLKLDLDLAQRHDLLTAINAKERALLMPVATLSSCPLGWLDVLTFSGLWPRVRCSDPEGAVRLSIHLGQRANVILSSERKVAMSKCRLTFCSSANGNDSPHGRERATTVALAVISVFLCVSST
jgi:integrase